MGAWGIKAFESDEGLDINNGFIRFAKEKKSIDLGDVIELFIEDGSLGNSLAEVDFTYDNGAILLAEILQEYAADGYHTFYEYSEDDEEIEYRLDNIEYSNDNLDFLILRLQDILMPQEEKHDLHEQWRESSNYEEWKAHVESLLSELTDMKE